MGAINVIRAVEEKYRGDLYGAEMKKGLDKATAYITNIQTMIPALDEIANLSPDTYVAVYDLTDEFNLIVNAHKDLQALADRYIKECTSSLIVMQGFANGQQYHSNNINVMIDRLKEMNDEAIALLLQNGYNAPPAPAGGSSLWTGLALLAGVAAAVWFFMKRKK
jgi:hypothetical protein